MAVDPVSSPAIPKGLYGFATRIEKVEDLTIGTIPDYAFLITTNPAVTATAFVQRSYCLSDHLPIVATVTVPSSSSSNFSAAGEVDYFIWNPKWCVTCPAKRDEGLWHITRDHIIAAFRYGKIYDDIDEDMAEIQDTPRQHRSNLIWNTVQYILATIMFGTGACLLYTSPSPRDRG